MQKPNRTLLSLNRLVQKSCSRKTVLILLILLLCSVFIAAVVPQRLITSGKDLLAWKIAHPVVSTWITPLSLDHIFTSNWFAVILTVFLCGLISSTYIQIKRALRKTKSYILPDKWIKLHTSEQLFLCRVHQYGYHTLSKDSPYCRLIKYSWGFWGGCFLHIGMVIVLGSALLMLNFQQRGFLELHEGGEHKPGESWLVEENGSFADPFQLPVTIKLNRLVPEYWDTFDLKDISAIIEFSEKFKPVRQLAISLSEREKILDFEITLLESFGHAFYLKLIDNTGNVDRVIMRIVSPRKPTLSSSDDIIINENGTYLSGTYFVDIAKKTFYSDQQALTLYIKNKMGKAVSPEVSFRKGETHQVGPYEITFVKSSYWVGLLLTRSIGMPGIYLGFAFIAIGSFLIFFIIPREIIIKIEDDSILFHGKAYNFGQYYHAEFQQIIQNCPVREMHRHKPL